MQNEVFKKNWILLNNILGISPVNLKMGKIYYYKSEGYMDLCVERIKDNCLSLIHYYIQTGDKMCDPDMEVIFDSRRNIVEALTFQQDSFGIFERIYTTIGGRVKVNEGLKKELNSFLNQWLRNIKKQGYKLYLIK